MTSKNTTSLHADVIEGGTGPVCLFIHGFLSSRAQWRLNLDALKTVCQPIVIELWGHGRSAAPSDPTCYTIDSLCAEFEKLRDKLGVNKWFVFGQSFGAGLAMQYAYSVPARVLGVIVTNSVAALSRKEVLAGQQYKALCAVLEVGDAAARHSLKSMPMHVMHARRLPPELMTEMLADADLLDPQAIALLMRCCLPSLSVVDIIGQLPMPLMLLNGRFEAAFQPMRELAVALQPSMEVINLDGGHAINIDCFAATNAAVTEFIVRNEINRAQQKQDQSPKQYGRVAG